MMSGWALPYRAHQGAPDWHNMESDDQSVKSAHSSVRRGAGSMRCLLKSFTERAGGKDRVQASWFGPATSCMCRSASCPRN